MIKILKSYYCINHKFQIYYKKNNKIYTPIIVIWDYILDKYTISVYAILLLGIIYRLTTTAKWKLKSLNDFSLY